MIVNPLSLITAITSLPGQIQGARNFAESLLKDKPHLEAYNYKIQRISECLGRLETKCTWWKDEWDAHEPIHHHLLAQYWGQEGCARIDNATQTVKHGIELIGRILALYSNKDPDILQRLQAGSIAEAESTAEKVVKDMNLLKEEAWEFFKKKHGLDEDEKMAKRKRRSVQHKTYLLTLAETYGNESNNLLSLKKEISAFENSNTFSCHRHDLALELLPGVRNPLRLQGLRAMVGNQHIVYYCQFRHVLRPLSPAHAQNNVQALEAVRSQFLRVQFPVVPPPPELEQSVQDAFSEILESQPRERYVRLGGSRPLFSFQPFEAAGIEYRAAVSNRSPVSNLKLASSTKAELAFKAVESIFLLQYFGWKEGLCSCGLRMVHLKRTGKPIASLYSVQIPSRHENTCQKNLHTDLSSLGVSSLGILLAEITLGGDLGSLEDLTRVPTKGRSRDEVEADLLNRLGSVEEAVEGVSWTTPSFVHAVMTAMQLVSSQLDKEAFYEHIIEPCFELFDEIGRPL